MATTATAAEVQVAKKCYKNQTAGWLGVVQLDHLGAQKGVSIPPYGTIYLTDEEAVLTARAPKDPKDNPFVEQMFQFYDENQNIVEQGMCPLVLIEDARYSPSDERFVPVATEVHESTIAAGQADTAAKLAEAEPRTVPSAPTEPVLVPSSSAAVPPSQAKAGAPSGVAPAEPEEDLKDSWVAAPNRTVTPQSGSLQGANGPAPGAPEGEAASVAVNPPAQQPINQPPAAVEAAADPSPAPAPTSPPASAPPPSAAPEEHAGVTPTGEETGAAQTPANQAPEGEFASHEEVGSPAAPTAGVPAT